MINALTQWRDAALSWCEEAWLWLMLALFAIVLAAITAALALGLGWLIVTALDSVLR